MNTRLLALERVRSYRLIGLFLAFYVLLAWASFIRPTQLLGITPWNPQPALAVALLLLNWRWLPWVWVAQALAEWVVRGIPHEPLISFSTVLLLGSSYAVMAWALAREGKGLALTSLKGLTRVVLICMTGAALNGLIFVSVHVLAGVPPPSSFWSAIGRYWIGDIVGFLVVLPLLMTFIEGSLRSRLYHTLYQLHWWLVIGIIGLIVWAIFGSSSDSYFKYFYVLLVPVAWLSVRFGLPGATLTAQMTQLWLLLAMQWAVRFDLTVFELQMLMAAIAATGMLLGVVVDEREKMAAELEESLHLAAAGQTAGALAHELNQPLTALSTYAHATRSFIAKMKSTSKNLEHERLQDLAQRMLNEAQRAAEIIKRLRNFFKTGELHLQNCLVHDLLQEAAQNARRRAQAVDIAIEIECLCPADLSIKVDPVQWAVVMRNLLANAMDAIAATRRSGKVILKAWQEGQVLRIDVLDSGPGLSASRLSHLFHQATASDKPEGMGIGLQISRAIMQAHGGELWAVAHHSGLVCIRLPLSYIPSEEPS